MRTNLFAWHSIFHVHLSIVCNEFQVRYSCLLRRQHSNSLFSSLKDLDLVTEHFLLHTYQASDQHSSQSVQLCTCRLLITAAFAFDVSAVNMVGS